MQDLRGDLSGLFASRYQPARHAGRTLATKIHMIDLIELRHIYGPFCYFISQYNFSIFGFSVTELIFTKYVLFVSSEIAENI
jgi:hypothetical protein